MSENEKKWALAATIIGSSMAFINGSVVNVALPAIQTALDTTVSDMQWVISIYTFILGSLILAGGAAGDYYGRKRVFGIGVFVFLASTIWCGLAPNVQQLIMGRAGQAVGGAFMIPGSLAIITDLYDKNQQGKAIGTWSAHGGALVDFLSWRFIFFISVPMALAALLILYWQVPEIRAADESVQPDWKGALLATLGLGFVCYGIIEGSELGITHPTVLLFVAAGMIVMGLFICNERVVNNPMVPLSLFRSRTFSGVNLVTMFFYVSLAGVLFLLPFNLIQVQGYSATAAGAAFLPFPLLVGGLSRWSGGLIDQYGARPMLVAGPVVTSIGFILLGIYGGGASYWINFFPGISFMGLGVAISYAPLNATVVNSVEESVAGTVSGVNKAISRLSGMLSVALLGAIAINIFGNDLLHWMQQVDIPANVQQQIMNQKESLANVQIPTMLSVSLQRLLTVGVQQSFLGSFKTVMYIAATLVYCGAICSATMVEKKKPKRIRF